MRQSITAGSPALASPAIPSSLAGESLRWWENDDLDDARRYDFTKGWDAEDAELGWVDAAVVSRTPRLH